jgi:hypothetical protein
MALQDDSEIRMVATIDANNIVYGAFAVLPSGNTEIVSALGLKQEEPIAIEDLAHAFESLPAGDSAKMASFKQSIQFYVIPAQKVEPSQAADFIQPVTVEVDAQPIPLSFQGDSPQPSMVLPGPDTKAGTPRKVKVKAVVRRHPLAEPGWVGGDTHTHTRHSDGFLNGVWELTRAAQLAHHKWIAITDHTQWLVSQRDRSVHDFKDYIIDLEKEWPVVVVPSLEYSSQMRPHRKEPTDSHLLAYLIPKESEILPNIRNSEHTGHYTGKIMIDELERAGRGMFCNIAHPYSGTYPWFRPGQSKGYDDVFRRKEVIGIEIMSLFDFKPKGETIDRVRDLLSKNMKVCFFAGSDTHAIATFGSHTTFVPVAGGTFGADDVVGAFREGRTIATTGPFALLTVDEELPGSTVRAKGGRVTLRATYARPSLVVFAPKTLRYWCSWNNKVESIELTQTVARTAGTVRMEGFRVIDVPKGSHAVYGWVDHTFVSCYSSPIYIQS